MPMVAAILAWLGALSVPIVFVAALKIFPKILGDVLIKGLEHKHSVRLEEIKDELGRESAAQLRP